MSSSIQGSTGVVRFSRAAVTSTMLSRRARRRRGRRTAARWLTGARQVHGWVDKSYLGGDLGLQLRGRRHTRTLEFGVRQGVVSRGVLRHSRQTAGSPTPGGCCPCPTTTPRKRIAIFSRRGSGSDRPPAFGVGIRMVKTGHGSADSTNTSTGCGTSTISRTDSPPRSCTTSHGGPSTQLRLKWTEAKPLASSRRIIAACRADAAIFLFLVAAGLVD